MDRSGEEAQKLTAKRKNEHDSADVPEGKMEKSGPVGLPLGPVPGLLFDREPATAQAPDQLMQQSATSATSSPSTWSTAWGPSIKAYIQEQRKGVLKDLLITYKNLSAALDTLEFSLLSPSVPAAACRAALRDVRASCRKEGTHPNASKFPTASETSFLEYVNVKLFWERGDTSLGPGGSISSENKARKASQLNPDYLTADPNLVGDHVRVAQTGHSETELLTDITAGAKDKLTTYPKKNLRVIVDVIPSGDGAVVLASKPDQARLAIIKSVKDGIVSDIRARLSRLDVVLSDAVVVVVEQKDLT